MAFASVGWGDGSGCCRADLLEATAIKAERVPALLQFCRVPLLAQLRWQLTASAKALGDTHSLSSKEAGEVCENIVGASLLLLKHYDGLANEPPRLRRRTC